MSILISLGEVGYFGNLCGRKGDIAATLTRILGVPICAKMLGVALTVLCQMRSCLVDLANKKRWTIKLDGLAERTHPHHQALLAETGAGFQLRPVKVAFRGRRAVRWEVPRRPLAGAEVFVPETTGAPQEPEPDSCLARATAEEPATSAASPPNAGSAAGSAEAQLRHQLTVAHGLMKLARERQEEERVAWQRAKAELERQVAAAEARAQAAVAELAIIRDQNHALTTRIAALELTTRQIVVGLADKLERAMAALAAAIDQQEVERQRRAAEAERHAGEVERLGRQAEELRRRVGELTLERDHYAAEAAHRGRLADEQRRRERLIAERDSHAVDAALAPSTATHPRVTDDQANEGDERATPGELAAVGTTCVMVTCVAWTLATLTFAAAHRRRAQSSPAHGTSHPGRAVARRRVRPTAARLPWIGSAECIGELGVQGPRGPPAWRG